jgi:predicted transcriptional regulator
MFLLREQAFIQDALASYSAFDSAGLRFGYHPVAFSTSLITPELWRSAAKFREDEAERFLRNAADIPETLPLHGLLQGAADAFRTSKQRAMAANLPLPTTSEIEVLKTIWRLDAATSSEIYAALDSAILSRYTAEDLQELLEDMSKRGFLESRKISAAHTFSFFGLAEIELLARNRRNKLYVYRSLISKEQLIRYLESRRYLTLSWQRPEDEEATEAAQHALADKLARLLR